MPLAPEPQGCGFASRRIMICPRSVGLRSGSYTLLMFLSCGRLTLDLSHPVVMGVLNVTPDSFSNDGLYRDLQAAIAHGQRMVEGGAAIIDVGGESTRPGAQSIPDAEEIARVVPVVAALSRALPSGRHEQTGGAALDAGAAMINDIRALGAPGALELLGAADARLPAGEARAPAVCLMHMQGEPRTMQIRPHYTTKL